jgi:hypothetical protein
VILAWFPELQFDDIVVTSSGVNGPDLTLSPAAQAAIPCVFEVKNQESIRIWEALDQSKAHAETKGDHMMAVLAFKRNRSVLKVAFDFADLMRLLRRIYELESGISQFQEALKRAG